MAHPTPRPAEAGFTYLGVMFIVVVMALGLTGSAQLWSMASKRERERELLWVGTQYAKALHAYHERADAGVASKQYPLRLEDLVDDTRGLVPVPKHHLRRLYPDPMAPKTEWGLLKTADGRIAGVYSQAPGEPRKREGFPTRWEEFAGAASYADWRFADDPKLRTQKKTETPAPP